MNLLSKIISPEERRAKRFRLGYFLSALLIPTAGVYYKYKVQIDDLFKTTASKASELTTDALNQIAFSGDRGPIYYEKENVRKINLKDIKKEPEPFSYESAETDPNVMGDPSNLAKYNEKAYKEYLASEKNSKESQNYTASDYEVKKYRVQKGDDAQLIADIFGISIPQLKQSNPGVDWGNLKTGQELKLFLIAGGPAGSTVSYSEKIPQANENKKSNKNTKTVKTKKTKKANVASNTSAQTAKLQKEKEKTEEKKETLTEIIAQKNSKEAKANPKETQKKINETINQSNMSEKEKKVAKEMSKQKDDKALKDAQAVLEKKEKILETAIETDNPLYYYQWPREIFDFTYSREQRANAYAYYLLTAVNSGVWNDGPYVYKIYETANFNNQTWAIIYFLVYRSGNLFNNGYYFPFNGKKITNERLFKALKKLRDAKDSVAHTSTAADTAYQNHWNEWLTRFGSSADPR